MNARYIIIKIRLARWTKIIYNIKRKLNKKFENITRFFL